MNCRPRCQPHSIEFDVDLAWCSACGHQWFMARAADGRPLGWRVSDFRRRVP